MGETKSIISAALDEAKVSRGTEKVSKSKNNSNTELLLDEGKKLDKIRDMLFGEHVSNLQEKYQTLDKNISDLRESLKSSVEELKQQIEDKFKQLQKDLQCEQADRTSQNEEFNTNLANVNSDLLTKIDLETKRIDDAINDQHEESMRQINAMVGSLQNTKLDRKSLALLFSQFAKELEGL